MDDKKRKDEHDAKPGGGQTAETQDAEGGNPPDTNPGTIHPDRTGNPPPPPPSDGDE